MNTLMNGVTVLAETTTNDAMSFVLALCNMYNVGCMIDYMNYTPRTLEEIIKANKKEK